MLGGARGVSATAGGVADADVAGLVAAAAAALARSGLRGALQAKRGTLQSYAQHALAVASSAAKMAAAVAGAGRGPGLLGRWAGVLGGDEHAAAVMGFLAGLVHDHNKVWGRGERESLEGVVASVLEAAGYVLGGGELRGLVDDLYAVAEAAEAGATPAAVASGLAGLAALVALADLLASAASLGEALASARAPEPRYRYGLGLLGDAGLSLEWLAATRPSLVLAEASGEILGEAVGRGCRVLLVYHDGALLLCPRGARLGYDAAVRAVSSRLLEHLEAGGEGFDAEQVLRKLQARKALELAARAWSRRGAGVSREETIRLLRGFVECGQRGGKAADCGVDEVVAAVAAAVAAGELEPGEALGLLGEAKRVYGGRLQKRNLVGAAKSLSKAVESLGYGVVEAVRRLVDEGRVAEAAGLVAAMVVQELGGRRGGSYAEELLRRLGLGSYAGELAGVGVASFPVLLGLLLRVADEPGRLVEALEEVFRGLGGGRRRAIERFAEHYVCSSVSGSILEGKACSGLGRPAAYCYVCRAPLPDREAGIDFAEYGRLLGLGRGVSELWTSDEPPLTSIQSVDVARATGVGRFICPACAYEAKRLSRGLGLAAGEKARTSASIVVYMMHPVASPEQLLVASLAMRMLAGAGGHGFEALWGLVEELAGAAAGAAAGEAVAIVDYFSARLLAPMQALGIDQYIEPDKRRSTVPTSQHLAALLAVAGPLLALLGGQVAVTSSLALREPHGLVVAGREPVFVEQARRLGGYRAGAAAVLSFASRASPLATGRDRAKLLEEFLFQVEDLSADPVAAFLAPPRPGLAERTGYYKRVSPGLYTELLGYATMLGGGDSVSRLLGSLRVYALAMCCAARGFAARTGQKGVSKHLVQGPLRDALYTVIEYQGVLGQEDLVELATGKGVEAARRRLGSLGPYEAALRDAIHGIAEYLAERLGELAPGKARELVEAVLDTVYMLFSDCWRSSREEKDKLCKGVASGTASTPSPS